MIQISSTRLSLLVLVIMHLLASTLFAKDLNLRATSIRDSLSAYNHPEIVATDKPLFYVNKTDTLVIIDTIKGWARFNLPIKGYGWIQASLLSFFPGPIID